MQSDFNVTDNLGLHNIVNYGNSVESFVWSHKIYSFDFLDLPELLTNHLCYWSRTHWGLARDLLVDSVHEGNSKTFESSAARWYLEAQGLVLKALDRAATSKSNEFFFFANMGPGCGIRNVPLVLLSNQLNAENWGQS